MPGRQLSARREIDKADTWFSLRSSPAYTKCCGSGTSMQSGSGGTGHKLNSQKCVRFAGRCLLDTYRGEVYPSYTLIEQGHWQSLY